MTTAEAARVGEELRDARLSLGATLEEVADNLRINRRYLAALEEGRSRDLPGPAYALGFVRSYARALGLDADDLARRYRENGPVRTSRTDLVFPEPVPERGIPAGVVMLIGVVIMVGAYAAWWRWSGSADRTVDQVPPLPPRIEQAARESRPAPLPNDTAPVLPPTLGQATPGAGTGRPGVTPPPPGGPAGNLPAGTPANPGAAPLTAAPAPSTAAPGPSGTRPAGVQAATPGVPGQPPGTPAASSPAPASSAAPPAPVPPPTTPTAPAEPPNRVTLRATDEVWVQVRDPRSGQTLLNRVLRSGETFAVPRDGLVLTTGRAQGLDIVVDGQTSPVLSGRTGVVRDIALNPEQLRQPRNGGTQPPAQPPAR
ncbi:helix-turn-helix domain-containing protein [Roseomonas sp. SSH11]|uniref:Helix-turn-helix domain-containing protein n=1 Tax=Pararoseomonas baculiformis TaxID=2820812 RepID=A0ABS4AKR6_9PROT|nr:helix-turn-helix domain-containing protein [Pararoseomonas baculiformis]MBP0447601.1 helix-turn-helix domain-containing protein [Pararoseomonas baculiformis]